MSAGPRAVVDLQARAFNAHDIETMARGLDPGAPLYRDGRVVAQGPEGARQVVAEEYGLHKAAAGTVYELASGERVMLEWSDAERGGSPIGVIRYHTDDGMIQAMRIEHDPATVRRLVQSGRRRQSPWEEPPVVA